MSFIHSWSAYYVHNDGGENGDVNGHTDDDIDDGDDDDDDDFDDDDDDDDSNSDKDNFFAMSKILLKSLLTAWPAT